MILVEVNQWADPEITSTDLQFHHIYLSPHEDLAQLGAHLNLLQAPYDLKLHHLRHHHIPCQLSHHLLQIFLAVTLRPTSATYKAGKITPHPSLPANPPQHIHHPLREAQQSSAKTSVSAIVSTPTHSPGPPRAEPKAPDQVLLLSQMATLQITSTVGPGEDLEIRTPQAFSRTIPDLRREEVAWHTS